MTDDKLLRQNAAAMIAFADRKTIQFRSLSNEKYTKDWADLENDEDGDVTWRFEMFEYRVKPEPVSRPWSKPEDVPGPVCCIRWISQSHLGFSLIIAVFEEGIKGAYNDYSWNDCKRMEYSTDRKTWHKCEVTE